MKVGIIICYYGKFPEYFNIWLKSVAKNPDFDFIIVTDISYSKPLPQNIRYIKMSFEELKSRIEKVMQFSINLDRPYKLCDFKPAYGLIFEKELEGYDFFGNCDIDLAFGDIAKYITNDILAKYEKILHLGHFTLYKNNDRMRNVFKEAGAFWDYKTAFQSKAIMNFDEFYGIMLITRNMEIKSYFNNAYADNNTKCMSRIKTNNHSNYQQQVFYWEDGKVFRTFIKDGKVCVDEFMYLHFQKKQPQNMIRNIKNCNSFYIFADKFIEKENMGIPSQEEIRNINVYKGTIYEKFEEIFAYITKLIGLFNMDSEERNAYLRRTKSVKIRKQLRRELLHR